MEKADKLPKFLKPVFWSNNLDDLDLQKDKNYIVNQVLAYGGIPELRWLFKTYPLEVVKKVFIQSPAKIYRAATFNFVKEILLEAKDVLSSEKYVINLPRIVR